MNYSQSPREMNGSLRSMEMNGSQSRGGVEMNGYQSRGGMEDQALSHEQMGRFSYNSQRGGLMEEQEQQVSPPSGQQRHSLPNDMGQGRYSYDQQSLPQEMGMGNSRYSYNSQRPSEEQALSNEASYEARYSNESRYPNEGRYEASSMSQMEHTDPHRSSSNPHNYSY